METKNKNKNKRQTQKDLQEERGQVSKNKAGHRYVIVLVQASVDECSVFVGVND